MSGSRLTAEVSDLTVYARALPPGGGPATSLELLAQTHRPDAHTYNGASDAELRTRPMTGTYAVGKGGTHSRDSDSQARTHRPSPREIVRDRHEGGTSDDRRAIHQATPRDGATPHNSRGNDRLRRPPGGDRIATRTV